MNLKERLRAINQHLRYQKLLVRTRAWIVSSTIPFCLFCAWLSWPAYLSAVSVFLTGSNFNFALMLCSAPRSGRSSTGSPASTGSQRTVSLIFDDEPPLGKRH